MSYDLIIIGAGPAGYVAAIRAGQTGLKTLVIDKKYIGGMCLNWGCIPTKNILESAKLFKRMHGSAGEFGIGGYNPDELTFSWPQAIKRSQGIVQKLGRGIQYLWKKNGVDFIAAEARIISPTEVEADGKSISTKNIIIATGSRPAKQTLFPEALEVEDFFALPELPKHPVLYGRGAIIVEFAQFFSMLGIKPIIVYNDLPLVPKLDAYLEAYLQKKLKKDKVLLLPQSEVEVVKGALMHQGTRLVYDAVLNCSLREAILPDSQVQLKLEHGYLATDEHLRTSEPGIFAAGDVNGKSYLAHAASAQGNGIVNFIHGNTEVQAMNYPINIYSEPELAQLGLTEHELKEQGVDYASREFPLSANGKALAEGAAEGFIRLLYENVYRQVLGVQIVGAGATDLIAEAAILMELEGTVYDLAKTVHAHPTIAEVFMDVSQD